MCDHDQAVDQVTATVDADSTDQSCVRGPKGNRWSGYSKSTSRTYPLAKSQSTASTSKFYGSVEKLYAVNLEGQKLFVIGRYDLYFAFRIVEIFDDKM